MSGIAGIVSAGGAPADPARLARMAAALAFRAPDGTRTWSGERCALAHGLLLTGDEPPPPPQPFSADGQVHVCADARIDARGELARALKAGGIAASPDDDAALLIHHAYRLWGDDCAAHLLGDFAFALWDAPRNRLFCARDHFGVKPFFYARTDGAFLFSNTLDCLTADPAVPAGLDEGWIGDFLVQGDTQDVAATVHAAIRQLPPAHTLVGEDGRVSIRRYWSLPVDEETRYRRPGDYIDHFVHLLREAVRDRLPQGAASFFLSGGRDSTSLAALARETIARGERATELRGHTAYYERLMPDREREFTELAADALSIPTEFTPVDPYQAFERWETPALRRPQPTASALMAVEVDQLSSAARHARVLLTGQGGDAVLRETRSRLTKLAASGRLLRAAREAAEYAWLHGRVPRPGVRTWLHERRGGRPWQAEVPRWVDAGFARRTGLHERVAAWNAGPQIIHPLRPEAYEQLAAPLWPGMFLSYDPGVTGTLVEVRHPYFDVRIVRFLLSIPPSQWYNDKGLLRIGMRGRLPERLLRRPKSPLVDDPLRVRWLEQGDAWLGGRRVTDAVVPWVNVGRVPAAAGGRSPEPPEQLWQEIRPLALSLWLSAQRR
jgi:asparagine synthase (glutamine-hydrolysing)